MVTFALTCHFPPTWDATTVQQHVTGLLNAALSEFCWSIETLDSPVAD